MQLIIKALFDGGTSLREDST